MIGRTVRPTSRGQWQTPPGGQYRHETADDRGGFRHRIACRDGRAGDWVQPDAIALLDDARAAGTAFMDILPVNTIFACERAHASRGQPRRRRLPAMTIEAPAERPTARRLQAGRQHADPGGR